MIFAGLDIEVTRDCNLSCPHCMRYEPGETMDAYKGSVIKKEYIDEFFEKYTRIEELTLTGGEPLLHPEMIIYIIDKIIEKNVLVTQFQIVTNGTIISEEIVEPLNRLYTYINDNFYKSPSKIAVGLSVSDYFHDNEKTREAVYEYYKEHLLCYVSYMSDGTEPDRKYKGYIYSGRAKTFKDIEVSRGNYNHKIAINGGGRIHCRMTLTLHGNFALSTQNSFQELDKPENIICHVSEILPQAIVLWNYKYPLNCKEAKYRSYLESKLQYEQLTEEEKEKLRDFIEYENEIEEYKKFLHREFKYLYPDDIEEIMHLVSLGPVKKTNIKTKNLTRFLSRPDMEHWCTCPDDSIDL